jgi:carboxymethylenebutenolidase
MSDDSSVIAIQTPTGSMPAHLWLPATGSGPGIVLVQEIFGVSDYIKSRAQDLADLGYVVCAPEVFWRLAEHDIDWSRDDVLQQAVGIAGRVDWSLAVQDVHAALDALRARSEVAGGVGLLGFCFGGGLAFNVAAISDPDVLVSYYGSALPGLIGMADQVSAVSLHHFGLSDDYLPRATVESLTEHLREHGAQVETYPDANHAFDNPSPAFYNAEAAEQAWATTIRFLRAHLLTNQPD